MSFLTPLFLIGGLAIAGPIIYHLVRRTTRERMRFSSLMFLLPSPPRLSQRHRVEHWLLLLLRCLALALLALGFSRPFFKQTQLNDPTAVQPKRIIVMVDSSASMRRAGLWDEARARTEAVLRRAAPTDQVALYTFDRKTTTLVPFDDWNRAAPNERVPMALGRLNGVTPSWAGTHLGNALVTASEALAETEQKSGPGAPAPMREGPRQIVLVSDLQSGSRLDALQAYEWPKGVELNVESVTARNPTNAGVQLVAENADAVGASNITVRVRVTNSGDAKREQFKVGWVGAAGATGDFAAPPIDAYVPPGQSRVFALPLPKGVAAEQVVLRGDDEDFDNNVYVIPPVQEKASVLWLGSEAEDDPKQPLFFVKLAFFDTPRLAVKVTRIKPDASINAADLSVANVIFVSEALPPAVAAAVREQALAGKTVVVVPKTAAVAGTIGTLVGHEGLTVAESKPTKYAMLSEIDFRHPLFAAFADPRFSDFTKITVLKYRRFDAAAIPDSRVVVKFDSGDPALIEVPVGKGRVFVLATGWHQDDSNLGVSSKFVPLLWSWLELGGGVALPPAQYFIGDKLPGAVQPAAPASATPASAASTPEAVKPGIFEANVAGRMQRFAVNLDPNESRTSPLGLDELEELGLPLTKLKSAAQPDLTDKKAVLQGVEAENRQKLWRWFIVATLAILLLESALAGWTARRAPAAPAEVTP